MKLKGKISILINREETTIEIKCEKSNSTFLKVHLTPEQLSESLSRCCNVDCEFVFSGYLEREETDKEYEYRMGADERLKNAKKANDLKIYERIKAEYNL